MVLPGFFACLNNIMETLRNMIIDSHCHLDFEQFDTDRDQVVQSALQAGVKKIIVPGITADGWQNQAELCDLYPCLYPAYGLHPYFLSQHEPQHLDLLSDWLDQHNSIGIGECGLDFYLTDLDRQLQEFFFYGQLDMAIEKQLPVIIHARKSTEQVIHAIKQRPGLRGMIHSYSGSYQQAAQLIELGFYISLGCVITHSNASRMHKLASQLPLDALLIETDAPDQPGSLHRGQRNEPAFITEVIDSLVAIKQLSRNDIIQSTTANAEKLFDLN